MKTLHLTYRNIVLLFASMMLGVVLAGVALHQHRAAERERMFASLPYTTLEPIVVVEHRQVLAKANATSAR